MKVCRRHTFIKLLLVVCVLVLLVACGRRGYFVALDESRVFVDFMGQDAFTFYNGHVYVIGAYGIIEFFRGQHAMIEIIGKPYTLYHLSMILTSGPSSAAGLGYAYSDSYGRVAWTWRIAANTRPGRLSAVILGGGDRVVLDVLVH
ncbi:MAG: hypothetical protein FWC95_02695 [Defluviitaleaceae bacterium]|nr:hypothetical protein [Defluviitaleaceae bacterium]